MFNDIFQIAIQYMPRLLRGAVETIRVTFLGVGLGFLIGILTGVIRAY
jgi:ABC-type amino acid transport system permease subunit